MVIRPHRVHDIGFQGHDLELGGEEVEVEEGADVAFFLRVAQGAGVEPADEEGEAGVVDFGEAELLGAGGGVAFVVEDGGEEGGVVAKKFFVEGVVRVFFADVDVDEGVGEKSEGFRSAGWAMDIFSSHDVLMEGFLGLFVPVLGGFGRHLLEGVGRVGCFTGGNCDSRF